MKKFAAMIGMAAMLAVSGGSLADEYYGKQKVVYHINTDDDKTLNAALGNVQNHMNAVGKDNIDMVVVMHGNGVDMLKKANKDADMQSKVINLKNQKVAMKVCGITLQKKNIDYKNDLFDVAKEDIVPSGVAELARLQGKGYVYVKP